MMRVARPRIAFLLGVACATSPGGVDVVVMGRKVETRTQIQQQKLEVEMQKLGTITPGNDASHECYQGENPPTPIKKDFGGCDGGERCKFLCKGLVREYNEKHKNDMITCQSHDGAAGPDNASADMKHGYTPTVDCANDPGYNYRQESCLRARSFGHSFSSSDGHGR
ncbi:unnamed protein product [Amoebophrya sp. A120]|nr:unnamed protein product [Amoebophrya sp. A120]|eukprot:GSA120T00009992001.1